MLASEKLDGMRFFWDGGISRGLPVSSVPWANTEKDVRDFIATGLWSRLGKIIHAPDDWLDQLPAIPLDGEGWTKRDDHQNLMHQVKGHSPAFEGVKFMIFNSPPLKTIFADGHVRFGSSYVKKFIGCCDWAMKRLEATGVPYRYFPPITTFDATYDNLKALVLPSNCVLMDQVVCVDQEALDQLVEEITARGGEGIVLHSRYSYYACERSWDSLKVKKLQDAEATVIGYTWGVEGKEGKLLGLMGSVLLNWNGVIFSISGFNESERCMSYIDGRSAFTYGACHFGERVQGGITNSRFPIGSEVRFQYRGKTTDGKPVEARYFR